MIKTIVINTPPWVALTLCKQTSVLNQLYSKVFMPVTVKDEILIGGKRGVGVKELNESGWLKVEKVKDIKKVALLPFEWVNYSKM